MEKCLQPWIRYGERLPWRALLTVYSACTTLLSCANEEDEADVWLECSLTGAVAFLNVYLTRNFCVDF